MRACGRRGVQEPVDDDPAVERAVREEIRSGLERLAGPFRPEGVEGALAGRRESELEALSDDVAVVDEAVRQPGLGETLAQGVAVGGGVGPAPDEKARSEESRERQRPQPQRAFVALDASGRNERTSGAVDELAMFLLMSDTTLSESPNGIGFLGAGVAATVTSGPTGTQTSHTYRAGGLGGAGISKFEFGGTNLDNMSVNNKRHLWMYFRLPDATSMGDAQEAVSVVE